MLKPVYPGELARKSPARIKKYLSDLWQCEVEYEPYCARAFALDNFDPKTMGKELSRDLRRLKKVADVGVVCDGANVFVELRFNAEAVDVISGERAKRDAEKKAAKTP